MTKKSKHILTIISLKSKQNNESCERFLEEISEKKYIYDLNFIVKL